MFIYDFFYSWRIFIADCVDIIYYLPNNSSLLPAFLRQCTGTWAIEAKIPEKLCSVALNQLSLLDLNGLRKGNTNELITNVPSTLVS